MTTRRWIDWVNVMLGAWLVASPWLIPVVMGDRSAAWSSWSVGAGIVMLALFAMYKPAAWGDAVGVIFGTWLIASPWMLAFANASAAAMSAVIIGMLVVGYALWAMRIDIAFSDGAEPTAINQNQAAVSAGSRRSHSRLTTA